MWLKFLLLVLLPYDAQNFNVIQNMSYESSVTFCSVLGNAFKTISNISLRPFRNRFWKLNIRCLLHAVLGAAGRKIIPHLLDNLSLLKGKNWLNIVVYKKG